MVTASPAIAVECRSLGKDFGAGNAQVRALVDVDLTVHAGELTLLVGPSGCGKTTLISIIAGLLRPTTGDVTVFGTGQASLSPRALVQFRASNIGFVFQQYNLLPALSAAENVAVPLLIGRVPRREALRRARALLDAVDLSARATRCRGSFRAGSSSAWPSPAPWFTSRGCWSATSPPRRSTPPRARQSWNSYAASPWARIGPSSS